MRRRDPRPDVPPREPDEHAVRDSVARALPAERLSRLRELLDDGYYNTPRIIAAVARRITESGDL